jgi:hypothetical protein
MWWQPADEGPDRPTVSIVLVIAFQVLVGVLTLLFAVKETWLQYFSGQAFPDPGTPQSLSIMFAVAVFWIACAIGLFKLRNWSRWLSLALASTAVIVGGLGMLLYKQQVAFDFTPFFFELLLKVSILVSAWWWILLTRKDVREQFQ